MTMQKRNPGTELEEKDYLIEFYRKYPSSHLNRSTKKPMTYEEFQEMDAFIQKFISEEIGGEIY